MRVKGSVELFQMNTSLARIQGLFPGYFIAFSQTLSSLQGGIRIKEIYWFISDPT